MKNFSLLLIAVSLWACQSSQKSENDSPKSSEILKMDFEATSKLVALPLKCATQQYPNKLGQVLDDSTDLRTPQDLHPAFYGCFDWHSAVHGHWSMVELIKLYPNLKQADRIKSVLETHLSEDNIKSELAYFQRDINKGYERMYGWAWFFKLSQSLYEWDDDLGPKLYKNLNPLADELKQKFGRFIPKLVYPIRVGEHTNTAFALNMMYEYANAVGDEEFKNQIKSAAIRFYQTDQNCPLDWEPSGYDFLSPCLEEAVLMEKILEEKTFYAWIDKFIPQLQNKEFSLEVAKVSDRSDGKLVHLDGLNFSRAWNLFKLSKFDGFNHLRPLAIKHYKAAYPNLVDDAYEGGHWLGSFAVYANLAQ
ncbi:DUF2891 domain-containing protein [Psychroflexus sp. MBR-150]|jgi:hypothetical protein